METMAEISAGINLIDVKKEGLRRAFLQLQSESPSSLNFDLKWTDLDSYFTTLRSSLDHKFNLLQTLSPSPDTSTTVVARPQLKSLCQNSDGLGLRQFMLNAPDRLTILAELPDAYRYAPDAAAMVLDAMEGFYSGKIKIRKSRFLKSACVIMLEALMRVKPDVTVELKDKAMQLAIEWNSKKVTGPVKDKEQNVLGFLLLVGAYGLIDGFSIDELVDCYVIVAKRSHTFDLCRQIIPADKISDLIQKLINKDMHIVAVKFSIEYQKTDEFPPVYLLEERKLMCEKTVEETHKNVKDRNICNEVIWKEVNTLNSIMKCVDEYQLESEFPKDSLVALIKKLENEAGGGKRGLVKKPENERKRAAKAAFGKKQLLLSKAKKQPKVNKFLLSHSHSHSHSHLHSQPPDLLPPHPVSMMPAAVGPSFYLPQSHPQPAYYTNLNPIANEYHPPYYPH